MKVLPIAVIVVVVVAAVIGVYYATRTSPTTATTQPSLTSPTTTSTTLPTTSQPTTATSQQTQSTQPVTTATTATSPPPASTTTQITTTTTTPASASQQYEEALHNFANSTIQQATLFYTGYASIAGTSITGNSTVKISLPSVEFSYYRTAAGVELYINSTISITAPSNGVQMSITIPAQLGVVLNQSNGCLAIGSPLLKTTPVNASAIKFCGKSNYTNTRELGNLTPFELDLTYVGTGNWRGETTYCFATLKPFTSSITPYLSAAGNVSTSTLAFNASQSIDVTRLCLLGNGVPTEIEGILTIMGAQSGRSGEASMGFSINLTGMSPVFDSQSLNRLLSIAVNGTRLLAQSMPQSTTTPTIALSQAVVAGAGTMMPSFNITVENPTQYDAAINGFDLGGLLCSFNSPITINAGSSAQLSLRMTASGGNLTGVAGIYGSSNASVPSGDGASCIGIQSAAPGTFITGYLIVNVGPNSGQYPFTAVVQ